MGATCSASSFTSLVLARLTHRIRHASPSTATHPSAVIGAQRTHILQHTRRNRGPSFRSRTRYRFPFGAELAFCTTVSRTGQRDDRGGLLVRGARSTTVRLRQWPLDDARGWRPSERTPHLDPTRVRRTPRQIFPPPSDAVSRAARGP